MEYIPGKIYKFTVTRNNGGQRKNKVTETEHRGKFIKRDGKWLNFHLLPGALKFIDYKVDEAAVSKAKASR